MVADKIRIKKYQQEKVEQWCEALEINESRFVEDAITFYVRYLEGKHPLTPTIPIINSTIQNNISPTIETKPLIIESDNPEDFDGGLDL
ncbi:hypothetical protein H6G64_35385 [Calothrix sp. FACHB-156]|nr:hypothetical protein [Calothrix sp. FACHB-156]